MSSPYSLPEIAPLPSYSHQTNSESWVVSELKLIGVIFGFTLGFGCFLVCHAVKKTQRFNFDAIIIWLSISSNLVSSCIAFCSSTGILSLNSSLSIYLILLWDIQLNCVFQLMARRITMVWSSTLHGRFFQWGVFIWTLMLNILFHVWIPVHFTAHHLVQDPTVWYRTVAITCLLTNTFLHAQFMFVVKTSSHLNGLKKKNKLLKFAAKIMLLCLVLDLLQITLMFLRSSLIFASFFPLMMMIKTRAELVTNDLMTKIVNSANSSSEITNQKGFPNENTKYVTTEEDFKKTNGETGVWETHKIGLFATKSTSFQNNKSETSFFNENDINRSMPSFTPFPICSTVPHTPLEPWSHNHVSLDTHWASDIIGSHFEINFQLENH